MTANKSQNEIQLFGHQTNRRNCAISSSSSSSLSSSVAARRERVVDHPLKSRSNSPLVVVPNNHTILPNSTKGGAPPAGEVMEYQSMGSHSSLTTTINTASLIQSAARSVLDSVYTPTSTNVSDDEEDDNDDGDDDGDDYMGRERKRQQQQQPGKLPTLDSLKKEALPALPDEQDRKRFVGCLAAVLASAYDYDVADQEDELHAAESYAYLNRTEQGHDGDDEEGDEEGYGFNNYHSSQATAGTTATGETWDTSFTENDDEPYLSNACSTSFEYSDVSQLPGISESDQPHRQSQQQQQHTPPTKERQRKKSTLARNRHRKRRYDLLSKLLLSSAELLLLDKSQARAFLPMLARLLMPPSSAEKTNEFRIRQQKQQERQQQQPQQGDSDQDVATTSSVNTANITTTPSSKSSLQESFSYCNSPKRTNISHDDKGINHYHFSPANAMPISRQIPLPESEVEEEDCTFLPNGLDEENHLRPFLESLSPGAGFRCLSLLLLQHLLHSAEGYDARIRHVIKKLGVIVLLNDMEMERDLELLDSEEGVVPQSKMQRTKQSKYEDKIGAATRKFEGLEHSIAVRLIRLSKEQQRLQEAEQPNNKQTKNRQRKPRQSEASSLALSREQLVRGLKIGSAGLVAGTIFAVTGGLAAPGIAAGVAAIAGSTAATAAVAALVSSTPAVTAIFGVGGGSLAAYKMNRRTQGLTEFEFRRQDKLLVDRKYEPEEVEEAQAELFSTVCISGWLRDQHDFQRPWGILPSNPRIRDRLELLERFYAVYKLDHVNKCKNLLLKWKGEEKQLWELLREKYGRDPDHLYPIASTKDELNSFHLGLTLEQQEVLNELFVELGYVADVKDLGQKHSTKPSTVFAFEDVRQRLKHPFSNLNTERETSPGRFNLSSHQNAPHLLDDSVQGPGGVDGLSCTSSDYDSAPSTHLTSGAGTSNSVEGDEEEKELPKHISTVWDYHSRYGGEVYTLKWESEMLIEVCDSVADLAFDLINGATTQLLRQTALHTLLNAVAVPYALINAANMIDGTWTLVVERADEAGKELAKSLLFSRAGHRPVTLVGFSFGARAIYSCLKELARYQEKWETSRETNKNTATGHHAGADIAQGQDQYPWTMREPASIVEDVILMGLPNHLSLGSWRACRQVVGGRLVNCYSRKDLILSLMFQIKRLAGGLRPVCGTCPVHVPGVENVDVSDIISGHQDYCVVTGEILRRVRHGQPFRSSPSLLPESNVALLAA